MSNTGRLEPIDVAKLIGIVTTLKISEGLKPQDIYSRLKPEKLLSKEYDTLIRAQNFEKPEDYNSLYKWTFEYITENDGFIARNIDLIPVLQNLFDGRLGCKFVAPTNELAVASIKLHERISSYFLDYAENRAPSGKKSLQNYVGTYQVLRYATSSERHPNARVIVACATINAVAEPRIFPEFTLHFPPRRKVPVADLPTTKGVLFPLDKHVFMIGQDKESDYPAIVVFPYQKTKVHSLNGLVLRRHIEGHIITARCHFVRHDVSEGGKTKDQLLNEVAIPDEDSYFIQDGLEDVLDQILNKVPLVGKGTLRLVP